VSTVAPKNENHLIFVEWQVNLQGVEKTGFIFKYKVRAMPLNMYLFVFSGRLHSSSLGISVTTTSNISVRSSFSPLKVFLYLVSFSFLNF
jgi:hypothetical protein